MRDKWRLMKWIFLFFGLLYFSGVFAQGEFLNKTNSIAPSGSGMATPGSGTAPSVFKPIPKTNTSSSATIEKKSLQFTNNNQFSNPGEPIKSKLNKSEKEYNPNYVKRDQFFGVFNTKSEYVKVCYRDFGQIDMDVVTLFTPDLVLVTDAILDMECKYIKLRLLKGDNKITLMAMNEGDAPPNTGELQIIDEEGNMITFNQWELGQGYTASVIIHKE